MMTYFKRKDYDKSITNNVSDFEPGDIISWELSPGVTHIGILLSGKDVYHNMGPGSTIESDFLFRHRIIGLYRIV